MSKTHYNCQGLACHQLLGQYKISLCAHKVCLCFFLTLSVKSPHIQSSRCLANSRCYWILTILKAWLQTHFWSTYKTHWNLCGNIDSSKREKKKYHEERILQEYYNCWRKSSLATLLHKSSSTRNLRSKISTSAMTQKAKKKKLVNVGILPSNKF
jgi:hypothetical protein